ncbi:hypothetical protein P280DRAFT_464589 [Massarina eburnea CBS 473.64]|uniref:MARVEL domain-containing protein n=1 Tax=Massarina eburnea CBS 473.64 TaxID=1395130 RepID=A0A6A6SET4_9PLEO|nr:hypothetical protein P280DRAFT_464589 [Massarina eburnea CBS 473.64]
MAYNFFKKGSMKGEKAGRSNQLAASLSFGGILRLIARFFQFVLGITIIGLYAIDLDRAHKAGVGYDSKWMYATVVGTLSAFIALVFMLPLVKAWFFFYVDLLIFILYLTAFGIFGKMYIKEDPEGNKGIIRMKRAVWIQLVNMILWFGTAGYGAIIFWKERKASTSLSGRAQSHV